MARTHSKDSPREGNAGRSNCGASTRVFAALAANRDGPNNGAREAHGGWGSRFTAARHPFAHAQTRQDYRMKVRGGNLWARATLTVTSPNVGRSKRRSAAEALR